MELRSTLKRNAKRALTNFWGQAVAIALLVVGYQLLLIIAEMLLMGLFNMAPYIDTHGTPANPFDDQPNTSPLAFALLAGGWLLSFIVGTPLGFGVRRWFYLRGGSYRPDFGDIFYYFASPGAYLKSLWVGVHIAVRRLLWGILFMAPGAACIVLGRWAARSAAAGGERLLASGLTVSGIIILGCGGILLSVFLQRFMLARYLCFEDANIAAVQAIRLSIRGTRGHRTHLVFFMLSFAGWALLCVLGLPILYVLPYYLMAHGIYARLLITQSDLMDQLDGMRRDEQHRREESRRLDNQQMGKNTSV